MIIKKVEELNCTHNERQMLTSSGFLGSITIYWVCPICKEYEEINQE